ncbi:serine protease [Rhizobium sp. FKL33]|uniref:trypsin-like serine peptidase n=1 Tax=Rhizobium sp. FKL33 TaxID=2562307 RepID=UPI001FEFFA0E|nr:serine protease [Rhizobium sp. FKL33]
MCPFNEASAFLVHQGDVILTARHVIFPERSMVRYAGRPALGNCGFEVTDGKTSQWYRIDVKAIIYPDDRQRSFTDRFDWIAMKLAEPIPGVKPYKLPVRPAAVKDKVTAVSIRQDGFPFQDWNERIVSECQVRKTWAIDGISGSGLETDCDLTMKSSGSPVLRRTDDGWDVVGIASSGTADCPKFRSKRCANWAVGLTDAVADAVRKLAAMPSGATKN